MDILSLIPPKILNKRGNADDTDTSIEQIEEELLNDIQNLHKADCEEGVQEEIDEDMDADIMPEITTAEKDMNEGMVHSNANDTAENNTDENIALEVDGDNRNILEDITLKLLNGQRRKKWKDM